MSAISLLTFWKYQAFPSGSVTVSRISCDEVIAAF